MGPKWYRYNDMTERTEYLHVKKGRTELFTEHWSRAKKWHTKSLASSSSAAAAGSAPTAAKEDAMTL